MNINSYKSLYIESCFGNGEFGKGIVLSSSTGFLISKKEKIFLITNRHVVTGKDTFTGEELDKINCGLPNELIVNFTYKVVKNGQENLWQNPFLIPLYRNGEIIEEDKLWLEHPEYKDKIDIIALDVTSICQNSKKNLCEIGGYSHVEIPVYDIFTKISYNPEVTEQTYIVGFPYGYSTTIKAYLPIWSNATIASEYEQNLTVPFDYKEKIDRLVKKISNEEDNEKKEDLREELKKVFYFEAPTFLVDAKTRYGQSGSPVILDNKTTGKIFENDKLGITSEHITILLGIYSGRINKNSDLGYVWKTELIREIIQNDVNSKI